MPDVSDKYKITFGGWYQRTTLHLSEIYELFIRGHSKLPLSQRKLMSYHKALDLKNVIREASYLEYVKASTSTGINIRYYEDGLYILEYETDNIDEGKKILKEYFKRAFSPAVSYIFSLGAPTPKILANVKDVHPIVVTMPDETPKTFKVDEAAFGEVYSKISSQDVFVYKTSRYIFVVSKTGQGEFISELIEMQIFFREFKDQLEKYLFIHRRIWEEIATVKEQEQIRGSEIEQLRSKLDSYQKTVNLITHRISQMAAYIQTRQDIAKDLKLADQLVKLFQYKFEILSDTHSYISDLWKMTEDYLSSAIDIVVEIKSESTFNSLRSVQAMLTLGIISSILGFLARKTFPEVTLLGMIYFFVLLGITWIVQRIFMRVYQERKYKIKFSERVKDI